MRVCVNPPLEPKGTNVLGVGAHADVCREARVTSALWATLSVGGRASGCMRRGTCHTSAMEVGGFVGGALVHW